MTAYITELLVDGQWQNVTPDVRDSDPIVLERGRRDWATDTDPSTCSLRLNNGPSKVAAGVQGRYSPLNPRSDLFGKIGRNTPIRVREDAPRDAFMVLPGFESSYVTTPDVAALDVTGDLELRLDFHPPTWRPDEDFGLARKYDLVANQRSWVLLLDTTGIPYFRWSPDGTIANAITVFATAAIPSDSGRVALKITLDVNNGAAGSDVQFLTAPSIDGTYTQLGTTVTTAGVTSVHSGTAPLEIGRVNDPEGTGILSSPLQGTVYAFSFRSGIAGAEVANPDFTVHEPDTRTVTDDAGRTWTLHASAALVDLSIRFTGEAKSWPPEWDLSGADRWVKLTAAGITRRLQRGKKPLKSSLFRDLSIKDDVVAYWPLEDVKGATRFNAGRPDDSSFLIAQQPAAVTLAADEETFFASAPLPTVGAASIAGTVPNYTSAADQRFVFLISIPVDVTWATEKTIARIYTTGTIKRWDINKTSADSTRVQAFDADGVQVENQVVALNMFGLPCAFSLWLQQDGANVDWQIAIFPLGGTTALAFGATIAGRTYRRISRVVLGTVDDMEATTYGHAFILNGDVQSIWDTIRNSMVGWTGETGLSRLVRLANDDGLPAVRSIGANNAETMGPQLIKAQMELFREVPAADLGILTDRPDAIGLQYRSRTDLYSQDPALVLDYSSGIIAEPFRPVEDDQNIVNEVTVERVRGAAFTAADTTGPLSSLDPPDGVGRYDISQEINIDTDERLEDQAFWRLHLGTIDEPRFPEVTLNLRNARAAELEDAILSVTEGDIIRITNPPQWLPGGPYDLLVEGIREEKSAVTHLITFAASPGSAWSAFMLDSAELGRLDTGGSSTSGALTATQTVFNVATAAGSQVWLRQAIGLVLPGVIGSYASTPDNAALDITGDIEIRVEVRRDSWSEIAAEETLVAKWGLTGNQRSYWFTLLADGILRFRWSTTGANTLTEDSSVPVPLLTGEWIALKVTRSAATGNVTFSFAASIDATYTQLGAVQASTPSAIFASTAVLAAGQRLLTNAMPWEGTIHKARVYNGIAGTVVANPDFTAQPIGAGSFTDSAGRVWTVVGDARIQPADPFDILVAGEVMQVRSITGTTSPQEFTVKRAVNGVAKPHTTGSAVVLAKPFRLSL
ncbi:hypothetical protein [Promicromonospora sp. NPDC023805]|uniref:hypothetical protein n=1 Tax=Promicromonospora sp. NPDC023805 TaxID=3154696 RepID=UPI0033CD5B92